MICKIFYRIGSPTKAYERPYLYGYTFDKNIAKAFRETRDMRYFIEKEIKMTKEEKLIFEKKYRKYFIHKSIYETRKIKLSDVDKISKSAKNIITTIEIPSTLYEEEEVFIRIDQIFHEIGKEINFYEMMQIGTDDFKDILKDLLLPAFRTFGNITLENLDARLFSGEKSFHMIGTKMKVDQFGVFLHLYGDTLKQK